MANTLLWCARVLVTMLMTANQTAGMKTYAFALSKYCSCARGRINGVSTSGFVNLTFYVADCSTSADEIFKKDLRLITTYGDGGYKEKFNFSFNTTNNVILEQKEEYNDQAGIYFRVDASSCQYVKLSCVGECLPTSTHSMSEPSSRSAAERVTSAGAFYEKILAILLVTLMVVCLASASLCIYVRKKKKQRPSSSTNRDLENNTNNSQSCVYSKIPHDDHRTSKTVIVLTLDHDSDPSTMALLNFMERCKELEVVNPQKCAREISLNKHKWVNTVTRNCKEFIVVLSERFCSYILEDSTGMECDPMISVTRLLFQEMYQKLTIFREKSCRVFPVYSSNRGESTEMFKRTFPELFSSRLEFDITGLESRKASKNVESLLLRLFDDIQGCQDKRRLISEYINAASEKQGSTMI